MAHDGRMIWTACRARRHLPGAPGSLKAQQRTPTAVSVQGSWRQPRGYPLNGDIRRELFDAGFSGPQKRKADPSPTEADRPKKGESCCGKRFRTEEGKIPSLKRTELRGNQREQTSGCTIGPDSRHPLPGPFHLNCFSAVECSCSWPPLSNNRLAA